MSTLQVQGKLSSHQKQKSQEEIDFQREIVHNHQANDQNEKSKVINQIDINDKFILLATLDGLYIMDSKHQQNEKKKMVSGDVMDAVFLPKTNYVAYCLNKKEERKNLYIFNLKEEKIAARLKIQAEIQQIKPSRSCIALASLDEIFVIHFPSLKPICNLPAGNSANIIFALSYEGLTIAHNSFQRGQLIIRNFTNIRKNNAITERKRSIYSSRVRMDDSKPSEGMQSQLIQREEEVESLIKVKAHIDMLSQIKISPNGSKVVTASAKGTVLRIFSTRNGRKLEEFRVGYELVKIVDVSFVQDGNIVGCMNAKGKILLYNVSMDKQEKQYEKQRIGHKIYTQSNPKSFFSFLSIFYPPLNDSFSFNHFQLINPEYREDPFQIPADLNFNRSFSRSSSMVEDKNSESKDKILHNYSIEELEEEHLEEFPGQKNIANLLSHEDSLISEDTSKKQKQQHSQPQNKIPQLNQQTSFKVMPFNRDSSPIRSRSLISKPNKMESRMMSNRSLSKGKLSQFQKKYNNSVSSRTQRSKKEEEVERPFYNLVSKLYITQANYIWAIKGYHIFGLKYDAFHGGEMILDYTKKIE